MFICQPTTFEFDFIKVHIAKFELDDRELKKEEFLIVKDIGNKVVAFGRIRKHSTCDELCSLGVIEPQRLKGIGKILSKELIKKANEPLFLTCIIPKFFEPLGFQITKEYPQELKDKLNYCTDKLYVPEEYVVMKFIK